MQDRVEGVGRVARVQVAPGVLAVAVDAEGSVALEEVDEFGDDFWRTGIVSLVRMSGKVS